MFGFSKKNNSYKIEYDVETQSPVIKCSICNGERIAGFKDKHTGRFTEVMLIRNDSDLEKFMKTYGLTSVSKEY